MLQVVSPTISSTFCVHCAVGPRQEPPCCVPHSTRLCPRVAPTRREPDPACPGNLADRAPGCVVHKVPHFGVGISDIAASSSRILIPPLEGCCSVTGRFSAPPSRSHVRPLQNRRAQGFRLHIGRTHHVSTATAPGRVSVSAGTRLPPLHIRHYPIMCSRWMAMPGRIFLPARVGLLSKSPSRPPS
ncbi:hypothetical protein NDU88_004420 [Pleurodeles waltl]|uniref:Uncharacterized protein n=1 Tax=Pleurodeles waltl TaxID=8319 RepID=A0AAV7VKA9_PLEWA|nr:hypothetical protein NDU88_004420 [Pleurodeles waltl]